MKRLLVAFNALFTASLSICFPVIADDEAKTTTEEWRTYNLSAEWRTYGPIRLDWAGWNKMGESYVTRGKNSKELPFWLSVSCEKLKINVTGKDGKWMSWAKPKAIFEYGFVGNLCSSKGYDISALSKDTSRGAVINGVASSNNNSWQGYYNYKSYLDNYNTQQQMRTIQNQQWRQGNQIRSIQRQQTINNFNSIPRYPY